MILRSASGRLPSGTVLRHVRLKFSVLLLLFVCNFDSAQWSPNCIVIMTKDIFCDMNQLNKRKWKLNLYVLLSIYFF